MATNKIGVNFNAKTKELEQGAKKAENAIRSLSNDVKKMTGAFNESQKQIRGLRNLFLNITSDANRANSAFGKLGKTLKIGLGVSALYGTANALKLVIEKAMESTETLNLFEVAMGSATKATEEFVQETNKAFGFDVTNIRSAVGTYSLLAKSMGITSDNARTLSENTYKLAVDLASLTNVPINQVLADLRSGLVGQSETVYKYGIDVTEASLATEALNQGINKSVRNMSQGEKMALRYGVMLRQTKLAQGDFANTIDTASNQLRIAKEQLVTLVRTIGTAFIPILTAVLPYINGFISALILMAKSIATLFGFKTKDPIGIERGAQQSEDIADSMADGAGSAKKMKDYLSGLDELNVLNRDSGSGGGGTGVQAGDPNLFNFGEYDNLMDNVKNKAEGIGKTFTTMFNEIGTKLEPLIKPLERLSSFVFKGVSELWTNFLVPLGKWTWNELVPKAVELIAHSIDVLTEALKQLKPTLVFLWDFLLEPISQLVGTVIIGTLDTINTALGDLYDDWKKEFPEMEGYFRALGLTSETETAKVQKFLDETGLSMADLGYETDEVKLGFEDFIETIKSDPVLGGASKWLTDFFGTPIVTVMKELRKATDILSDGFSDLVKNMKKEGVFGGLAIWFIDVVVGGLAKATMTMFSTIASIGTGVLNSLKNTFTLTINSIIGAIESAINGAINGYNSFISNINSGLSAISSLLSEFGVDDFDWNISAMAQVYLNRLGIDGTDKVKNVAKFATGGFPNQGEMFIAREAGAELVGSIGGRTAVANNDQIVQAVSQGVAQAVASVFQSGGQVIENVLMLDGDVIYKNQQQVARRRGTDFGMGVFAR